MVTIDRERLISEKQNKKASAEGARLPKEAMLLRDIFKCTKLILLIGYFIRSFLEKVENTVLPTDTNFPSQ